jgi:hypothetical protein
MQFKKLDAKPMIQKTEQFIRVVNQAERNLSENPVVPKLKNMVWMYKEALPAVLAMRSPFLEAEHWEAIRALLAVDIDAEDPRLRLKDLFSYKIMNFSQELIEISTQALQESNLKKALAQIEATLSDTDMTVKPYKDSFVLGQVDELTLILD